MRRLLLVALALACSSLTTACGSKPGPSADQAACIKAFNQARGTATMYFQFFVKFGRPSLQSSLRGVKTAVTRVPDHEAQCLVTFQFPYRIWDTEETRFVQFAFPADWNPETDSLNQEFNGIGDQGDEHGIPGQLASDMPDSLRKSLDPHLALVIAPRSASRSNLGVESDPPLNIVYR